MKSPIAKKLLRWYASRRRSLPWREHPEPYAVWVAEIMAQQTRLDSMLPYYQRWMQRFPTLRKLAAADEQEVLAVWEGLGYYGRARNLHKAARLLVAEQKGSLPQTLEELQRLPGVGRYTAGAIASLAFGADAPAVDGNAMRVLARLFDVDLPTNAAAGQQRLWALAAEHLPRGQAAEYNQALMDLGAQICTPSSPKCEECPLSADCRAFALGNQAQRPVKAAAKPIPLHYQAAAAILRGERVLVLRRPTDGLLGGLWEFPNVETPSPKGAAGKLARSLHSEMGISLTDPQQLGQFSHAYSHFRVELQAYVFRVSAQPKMQIEQEHQWLPVGDLGQLPMGKLDRSIATALANVVG